MLSALPQVSRSSQAASVTEFMTPICANRKQFLRTIEDQNIYVAYWADNAWSAEWCNSASGLCSFIPDTGPHPLGLALPRLVWVRINHLQTSIGHFAHPCTNGLWSLQQSVSVAWRIKLQTIIYRDANTRHQRASVVCRSWMMTPLNCSQPHESGFNGPMP